jgi:mono/diheme cytochrome c family protein
MRSRFITRPPTQGIKILLLLAVLPVAALGCRGWTSEQPPVHLNPNMDTQIKYKPSRESKFFDNGRAMQMPVEGTVPRTLAGTEGRDADFLALDDHKYTGKVDGKDALGFPEGFEVNETTLARGQERYNIYCAPCHATSGNGKGTVARRYPIPPPTFHQERIHNLALGNLYQTITHGKNWPNMPSYANQIPVDDRWAIIGYLRALMRTQKPDLPLVPSADAQPVDPSTVSADDPVAKGKAIYGNICVACHSLDGSAMVGPTYKGIWGRKGKDTEGNEYVVNEEYVIESIKYPNKRVVAGYAPVMPVLELTDDDIQYIIAFMKTLK